MLGTGAEVSAAITAETVARLLDATGADTAGAWTPVSLFGQALLTGATAVEQAAADPERVWAAPSTVR